MISFAVDPGIVPPLPSGEPRIQRIVVTGPEATGKSTLARELAYTLDTIWVPEFSRTYAQSVARVLTADDVEIIARGQIIAEDDAERRLKSLAGKYTLGDYPLVFDTDLVSTTVYAEHYYGHCAEWIMDSARTRLADLYLLGATDLPWTSDGVRDQPHARAELARRFGDRLRELGATVLPVDGRGARRPEHALAAVRGWRAAQAAAAR